MSKRNQALVAIVPTASVQDDQPQHKKSRQALVRGIGSSPYQLGISPLPLNLSEKLEPSFGSQSSPVAPCVRSFHAINSCAYISACPNGSHHLCTDLVQITSFSSNQFRPQLRVGEDLFQRFNTPTPVQQRYQPLLLECQLNYYKPDIHSPIGKLIYISPSLSAISQSLLLPNVTPYSCLLLIPIPNLKEYVSRLQGFELPRIRSATSYPLHAGLPYIEERAAFTVFHALEVGFDWVDIVVSCSSLSIAYEVYKCIVDIMHIQQAVINIMKTSSNSNVLLQDIERNIDQRVQIRCGELEEECNKLRIDAINQHRMRFEYTTSPISDTLLPCMQSNPFQSTIPSPVVSSTSIERSNMNESDFGSVNNNGDKFISYTIVQRPYSAPCVKFFHPVVYQTCRPNLSACNNGVHHLYNDPNTLYTYCNQHYHLDTYFQPDEDLIVRFDYKENTSYQPIIIEGEMEWKNHTLRWIRPNSISNQTALAIGQSNQTYSCLVICPIPNYHNAFLTILGEHKSHLKAILRACKSVTKSNSNPLSSSNNNLLCYDDKPVFQILDALNSKRFQHQQSLSAVRVRSADKAIKETEWINVLIAVNSLEIGKTVYKCITDMINTKANDILHRKSTKEMEESSRNYINELEKTTDVIRKKETNDNKIQSSHQLHSLRRYQFDIHSLEGEPKSRKITLEDQISHNPKNSFLDRHGQLRNSTSFSSPFTSLCLRSFHSDPQLTCPSASSSPSCPFGLHSLSSDLSYIQSHSSSFPLPLRPGDNIFRSFSNGVCSNDSIYWPLILTAETQWCHSSESSRGVLKWYGTYNKPLDSADKVDLSPSFYHHFAVLPVPHCALTTGKCTLLNHFPRLCYAARDKDMSEAKSLSRERKGKNAHISFLESDKYSGYENNFLYLVKIVIATVTEALCLSVYRCINALIMIKIEGIRKGGKDLLDLDALLNERICEMEIECDEIRAKMKNEVGLSSRQNIEKDDGANKDNNSSSLSAAHSHSLISVPCIRYFHPVRNHACNLSTCHLPHSLPSDIPSILLSSLFHPEFSLLPGEDLFERFKYSNQIKYVPPTIITGEFKWNTKNEMLTYIKAENTSNNSDHEQSSSFPILSCFSIFSIPNYTSYRKALQGRVGQIKCLVSHAARGLKYKSAYFQIMNDDSYRNKRGPHTTATSQIVESHWMNVIIATEGIALACAAIKCLVGIVNQRAIHFIERNTAIEMNDDGHSRIKTLEEECEKIRKEGKTVKQHDEKIIRFIKENAESIKEGKIINLDELEVKSDVKNSHVIVPETVSTPPISKSEYGSSYSKPPSSFEHKDVVSPLPSDPISVNDTNHENSVDASPKIEITSHSNEIGKHNKDETLIKVSECLTIPTISPSIQTSSTSSTIIAPLFSVQQPCISYYVGSCTSSICPFSLAHSLSYAPSSIYNPSINIPVSHWPYLMPSTQYKPIITKLSTIQGKPHPLIAYIKKELSTGTGVEEENITIPLTWLAIIMIPNMKEYNEGVTVELLVNKNCIIDTFKLDKPTELQVEPAEGVSWLRVGLFGTNRDVVEHGVKVIHEYCDQVALNLKWRKNANAEWAW